MIDAHRRRATYNLNYDTTDRRECVVLGYGLRQRQNGESWEFALIEEGNRVFPISVELIELANDLPPDKERAGDAATSPGD